MKSSNIEKIEAIANELHELLGELVFVGGLVVPLLLTEPAAREPRPTLDIDFIVDVATLGEYYETINKIKARGFKEDPESDVVCRFKKDPYLIDVMPTEENILGFNNRWYKDAVKSPLEYELSNGVCLKIIEPRCFIACKLEAFKDRGKSDYLSSHDFEDIISVIEGRQEIVEEINEPDDVLARFIAKSFQTILDDPSFRYALPGLLDMSAREDLIYRRLRALL